MSKESNELMKTFLKTALMDGIECKSFIVIGRDILGSLRVVADMDTIEAIGCLEHMKQKVMIQTSKDGEK